MDPWTSLRDEMESAAHWIYLDHAAISPLPHRARLAAQAYLDELGKNGGTGYPAFIAEALRRARKLGGELMRAAPRNVFMVRSTTQGLAIAATGIPLRPGENVVLIEGEFPANLRPWLPLERRGVELRLVPQRGGRVHLDDLAAAVDPRTRAVSVSFVQFASGFRIDLGAVAALCRKVDALLVVDAIQGLGVLPLDVERDGIDFLSADSHKWLLGPEGAGLGYASQRALERIEPAVEGWLSVERPFDFASPRQPLRADAQRYEEGAYDHVGIRAMVGSLELLAERGVPAIAERLLALTDHLAEGLARQGWEVLSPRAHPGEKSGIVLARREGQDPEAVRARLRDAKIVVTTRGAGLRFSPHAYQTTDDLDAVLEALRA